MLGVHWPSDVVGGWAFGAAWVLLMLRLADRLGQEHSGGQSGEVTMNTNRPLTLLAAIIFALMALVHLYRIVTHFRSFGHHDIPMAASFVAIVITACSAVMLYRESQRSAERVRR